MLALVASCVADLSEAEQAEWDGGPDDPEGEVVVIEGEGGWDAGWWFPGPGGPQDPGDTGDWYGGGGGTGPGGGAGEPYDEWTRIPSGEDCAAFLGYEDCTDCCIRNLEKVWWPYCDRKGAKKMACKKHVGTYTFPACYKSCNGKPGDPSGPTCQDSSCP